ncbi:MAG: hypothetical protein KAS64_07640 [Spirochaetes bacterium]|nr:hypothetical protein [Spirochaetota bacterium]
MDVRIDTSVGIKLSNSAVNHDSEVPGKEKEITEKEVRKTITEIKKNIMSKSELHDFLLILGTQNNSKKMFKDYISKIGVPKTGNMFNKEA